MPSLLSSSGDIGCGSGDSGNDESWRGMDDGNGGGGVDDDEGEAGD